MGGKREINEKSENKGERVNGCGKEWKREKKASEKNRERVKKMRILSYKTENVGKLEMKERRKEKEKNI